MEKKKQKLKSITIIVLGLISLMCLLSLFPPSAYKPSAATSAEKEIATSDTTNYYMRIPLTKAKGTHSKSVVARGYPNKVTELSKLADVFTRKISIVTVVFTFCNARIEQYSVIATTLVTMEMPAKIDLFAPNYITFTNDVTINIRKEYYDFLVDEDISQFYMTILYNGKGLPIYNKELGSWDLVDGSVKTFKAKVELADTNTRPDDWEDDLNPIGDNGGTTELKESTDDERSGWQKLLDAVGGWFGVSATIAGVIVIFGGLLLLKIVFK